MTDSPENMAELTIEQAMQIVYSLYAGFAPEMDAETGAGGKLLYAGEADSTGCMVLRAANIAGTASLTASADAALLRKAMREGAIDFVVNSLDEALRILKNEIRKKQPVVVGVSVAPEAIEREMLERGAQPDLLSAHQQPTPELNAFLAHGARCIMQQLALPTDAQFQFFPIPPDWKQPASAFDALLLDCFAPGDALNRRWVRLAPRYLPAARRIRMVVCDAGAGLGVIARMGGAKAE